MTISERRITNKLLNYWHSIMLGRNFPDLKDVDPDAINEIWESCFVVAVTIKDSVPQYQFNHIGIDISAAYKKDLCIEATIPIISPDISTTKDHFDEVFETKEPLMEEEEVLSYSHVVLKVRQCFLPLGNKKDGVTAIIGAMSYKLNSEE